MGFQLLLIRFTTSLATHIPLFFAADKKYALSEANTEAHENTFRVICFEHDQGLNSNYTVKTIVNVKAYIAKNKRY